MPERRRAILLDSNLLLLLVIGSMDPSLIRRFKRTNHYTEEQFDRLSSAVEAAERNVTTPHVLTEVNNLANALPDDYRDEFVRQFRRVIAKFEERFTPARDLAESRLFRFGITDTAIYESANDLLILTTDGRLAVLINQLGTLALDLDTFSVLE